MRPDHVYYPQNVAPVTPLTLARPDFGVLQHGLDAETAARAIQQIGHDAWLDSGWLQALGRSNQIAASWLARQVFNPNDPARLKPQIERVARSEQQGFEVAYWLGTAKDARAGASQPAAAGINQPQDGMQYHGFIKIEQQGGRSSRLARLAQRAANVGIYACIHDLNVVPNRQGMGLATALAYAALSEQPARMSTSLYVADANRPMKNWAHKFGYYVTDEYEDTDTFTGASLLMLHYIAPSVGRVLQRMTTVHPWLTRGSAIDLIPEKGTAIKRRKS